LVLLRNEAPVMPPATPSRSELRTEAAYGLLFDHAGTEAFF
jgi:hypothetical protein